MYMIPIADLVNQQGHRSPNIYEGETSLLMSPQYFRSDVVEAMGLFYPVTAITVVCCILVQIISVVSQKSFNFWGTLSPEHLRGSAPVPCWGTSVPVFFYVPTIILRLTSLHWSE